jgi:hypothetical protein
MGIATNKPRLCAALRVLAIAAVATALSGSCVAQTDGSFSVSAALWPTPDFPVGNLKEIILAGQIRNESRKNAVWRGMALQSEGYGQVRAAGTQSPVCETLRTDERMGSWEQPFALGTSTPYRYEFSGLSCAVLAGRDGWLEARFCVNPQMFSPLPDGTCSAWVRVEVDVAGALLRRDDAVFREQMRTFQHTGDGTLQRRLLGALELRALRDAPSLEEQKLHPVGIPNEPLATIWLEFLVAEVAVMDAQKPVRMPTTNVGFPNGCWPTQTQPQCAVPAQEAEYEQAVRTNNELIERWRRFRSIQDTTQISLSDFGMCMGQEYRLNREEREKLYTQATQMGLPELQVSELRRFMEFATGGK